MTIYEYNCIMSLHEVLVLPSLLFTTDLSSGVPVVTFLHDNYGLINVWHVAIMWCCTVRCILGT